MYSCDRILKNSFGLTAREFRWHCKRNTPEVRSNFAAYSRYSTGSAPWSLIGWPFSLPNQLLAGLPHGGALERAALGSPFPSEPPNSHFLMTMWQEERHWIDWALCIPRSKISLRDQQARENGHAQWRLYFGCSPVSCGRAQ